MASNSETGHFKNWSNFERLISNVLGYDDSYNPPKESIKKDALKSKSLVALTAIETVNGALPAYTRAVAARDAAFFPVNKLITRIINSLRASASTNRIDESVKALAKKIQGQRGSSKKVKADAEATTSGEEKVTASSSHMSFDNRLDNFDKFIRLLAGIPEYTPNEEDLKIESLRARFNDLKSKNEAVTATFTPLSNARLARNKVLYDEINGLTDLAADVKSYIKSVFGATSPEYKQVGGIKFTTPGK